MSAIAQRLDVILAEIGAAAVRGGRTPSDVELVAVSKTKSVAEMRDFAHAARERGLRVVFGENYVQEVKSKIVELQELGPASYDELHLQGPLQSNKVRDAVRLFDVIESVHSLKVLELIGKEAARIGKRQRVMLQVNISGDPAKSGFSRDEITGVLAVATRLSSAVVVEGLMTITAFHADPEESREDFVRMAKLRAHVLDSASSAVFKDGLVKVSMGMSSDFSVAVEEGADLVRVGTALFGERDRSL